MRHRILPFFIIMMIVLSGSTHGKEAAMKISSTSFGHNRQIPSKYTCDGADINPPLGFEGMPAAAKSLALIADDPDAPMGMWVHWLVWNIDPKTAGIAENSVPGGAVQGRNDFGRHAYGGPCPPSGTHRYFFRLYALDRKLNISANTSKAGLESAMKGHILAEAQLIGLYKRIR